MLIKTFQFSIFSSSLFLFTYFPEVVMHCVPGDIFYELVQLGALLCQKKRIGLQYKFTLLLTYCCPLT